MGYDLPLTYVLLALAIVAVWIPAPRIAGERAVPLWLPLFAAAVAAGAMQGVLEAPALASLAVLCVLAAAACRAGRGRRAFVAATALCALSISLHLVPGFHPSLLSGPHRLTPDALPMAMTLGFDKAAAGLVLFATFCPPAKGRPFDRRALAATAVAAIATPAAAIGAAVLLGITRWEPKWPDDAAVFLAGNLLFTCVAEEAFFRGVIQERIARLGDAGGRRWIPCLAVVVSTLLFALAHAGGGTAYVSVVAVAGLGYGLVYAKTRRIDAAIAVHFAVNAAHFLGFAYPMLAH